MDLYLLSPRFLRKMMRRPSADGKSSLLEEDVSALEDDFEEGPFEDDLQKGPEVSALRGRRRSSLDRMLRQHAYIIICALCYACNTLPSHMTT